MPPKDSVVPQNQDAEASVIGAMLQSPKAIDTVAELLKGDEFYLESNEHMFKAILALVAKNEPVDEVTVASALEQRGLDGMRPKLRELVVLMPATANVGHYAKLVRDAAARRAVIRKGQEIAELGWVGHHDGQELIDLVQDQVFSLSAWRRDDTPAISEIAADVYRELEHLHKNPKALLGVTTSIDLLDHYTRGLRKGALYILAATTGAGKSALANCITVNLAIRRNLPVAFFSLEMSRMEIAYRMISLLSGLDHDRLTRGEVRGDEWPRLMEAIGKLAACPLHLETEASLTMAALRAKVRKLAKRPEGIGLVVVDYLQLVSADRSSESRTREVAEVARGLKQIAMATDVPVLALAQLNRQVDSRLTGKPFLSDLRESGEIEQAADVVFFIWKDPDEPEDIQATTRKILVAKNRHGERDVDIKVSWSGSRMRFGNLSR